MKSKRTLLTALAATATLSLTLAAAPDHPDRPCATLLVSGMASGSGSTIGPDGALYVTEGAGGRVLRVDPHSGHFTTYASGLPKSIVGIGGAMDVAFIDRKAYVLVTLVERLP